MSTHPYAAKPIIIPCISNFNDEMNQIIINSIEREIGQIARTARFLWEKGWAERNAGNLSLRIDAGHLSELPESDVVQNPLQKAFPRLSGCHILITSTGCRMRDLATEPERHLCLIRISEEDGKSYKLYHLQKNDQEHIHPSSELPTHLEIQQLLLEKGSGFRAVLHTHPTELIALTHIPGMEQEEFLNRVLLGMHPELLMFNRSGIAFMPFRIPGTDEIAAETLTCLSGKEVVLWEKHGVFAVGMDPEDAFDKVDLFNKAADIYLKVLAAGVKTKGLSDEQLAKISQHYPGI